MTVDAASSPPMALNAMLVKSGLVTQEALDEVLALTKTNGRRLTEILAERGLVRPHVLAQFLSHQLACPWVSLQRVEIAPEAVEKLPSDLAWRHHMVPVHLRTSRGSTALYVAMDDPTDDVALSEAMVAAQMPVKPMVALASEIKEQLAELYPAPPSPPPPKVVTAFPPPKISTGSRPSFSKPPPPLPISKNSVTPAPSILMRNDDSAVLEMSELSVIEDAPVSQTLSPQVLVVEADDDLLLNVQVAVKKVAAAAIRLTISEAVQASQTTMPGAIVVSEAQYAKDRGAIDRIALDSNALLIVSNPSFEGPQLEAQLLGAIERWRRAAYVQGAVLEGRYELLRDLSGRSKQRRAATWEVRNIHTDRRSIIKIGVRSSDASVRREQSALAKVHHPGALELRDAGITELGDPYIVVESVEGKTLEGLVAARGALEPKEAQSIIHQLAEILASAHEQGVSHDAVRAEHIVVWRDSWGVERVKLVYWESATVGAAPAAPNLDLAGVGACAFLALTGQPWSENEDIGAIKDAPLASLIKRALAKEGEMKGLVDALTTSSTQVLSSNPEKRSLRPPSPQTAREMRKHPRAPYRTPVRIEVAGIGAVDGRSEDISSGGLFVVTRGHIADRSQVSIRFALPIDGKVVSEMAVVKWSRAPNEADVGAVRAIGIELVSPGGETAKQIARYVQFMANEK